MMGNWEYNFEADIMLHSYFSFQTWKVVTLFMSILLVFIPLLKCECGETVKGVVEHGGLSFVMDLQNRSTCEP